MLLVSNRLPVSIAQDANGVPTLKRSSGGLIAGLGPIHDRGQGEWIGSLGGKHDDAIEDELTKQRLVVVDLDPGDAKRHYEGYSNNVLWPLFHYLLNHVTFDPADFEAYKRVNDCFADVVASRVKPGDRVWVHDYHLMLLPQMLRERLPDTPIGFFLHIPFPSSEVMRLLPRREEILKGLAGANLIGMHTHDFARHLVSSMRRITGVEYGDDGARESGQPSRIGVFPLGVDVAMHQKLANKPEVAARADELRAQLGHRKVVLGVDRLDYTKGIPLRLRAYQKLIEQNPEWQKDAVLLQLCVPSREGIDSYKALKQEVEGLVGAINGALEHNGHTPVHYLYRSVLPEELAAMYLVADVMLVTPIRDGMNLVIKEYVASRLDDTGVAVLSEFAGAASEFGEALLDNPWDVEGTAEAIKTALTMEPGEVATRMKALRERVARSDVHAWVKRFLSAFDDVGTELSEFRGAQTSEGEPPARDWVRGAVARCAEAKKCLFALDYDGTLVEIAGTPEAAVPTQRVRDIVTALAVDPGVDVVIVSGREHESLGKFFEGMPVHLVAEHGLSFRRAGESNWQYLFPDLDLSWRDAVMLILADYVLRSPGSFVEKKSASLAWHYRRVAHGFGDWQARELATHLNAAFAKSPLEVLHGNKVIEVRPQGVNKGRGVRLVMQQLGEPDFIFAAGDDRTDEDLFGALPPSATAVKIGRATTLAPYRLATPAQLLSVLRLMSRARAALGS
ncbi:MAG: bifunctional alpha,alpha-trehalose-phosphate synthase (UDP-forming)/trehalose-phosphatase [Clostridia bacterium]|nr:bifunctional alpha,alpha-trehalose-phosphate synthase (UDP-forming)/trehalose-phosphatase [Deltaproteobacteria bacterium]